MITANEAVYRECISTNKNCGVFEHPNCGIISVEGADRTSFLHNILSNDIKSLTPGKGVSACLLNSQAKIVSNFEVLHCDNHFYLICDHSLKDKALKHLNKLVIMENVQLADRSDVFKLISIHGPKSKELLQTTLSAEIIPNDLLDHAVVTVGGVEVRIIRVDFTEEIGFAFLVAQKQAGAFRTALDRIGASARLSPIGASALEIMRIAAGIPRYGIDFDDSNNPFEAGLKNSVSLSKGCYPGQEILARLDSREGVSKKLCGLVLKGEIVPQQNDRITKDEIAVGRVTSAAFSPILKKTIALGYLNRECWTVGSPVAVETDKGRLPARVEPLPF